MSSCILKYFGMITVTQSTSILLIEDDPAVARGLEAGLRREGYHVTWKNSGEAGMQYARDMNPHLIVLDVRLPDGSGFDFCRQMRQLGLSQPILMLTVQNEEMDKVLGLEMGADDYVTKPYGLRELLSRIRALLRRAYGELSDVDTSSDLLYVKDLLIDRGRGHVLRDGKNLNLTPIEFRLLVYLAQNHEQALSRGQILDTVWGLDTPYDGDHTINVHIRRLREKVEIDPNHPSLILTVPGVGYRLAR